MSRYNGSVNGYFICDRGRFGYEFVNDEKRIRKTKIRFKKNGDLEEVEYEMVLSVLDKAFLNNKKIIGIGSPRASVESNYALLVLAGKENFYHGISKKEQHLTKIVLDFLKNSGVQIPSLKQIEKADAVLVLGEDLANTAPMIALAVRQSARNMPNEEADRKGIPLWNDSPVRELAQDTKSPVYIATPFKDSLDEIAETTFRASYADIANLGSAVASLLKDDLPISKKLSNDHRELAENVADTLKKAKNPLIISGITCGDEDVLHAGMNIAAALLSLEIKVMFSPVLPECNSMGLAFIPGKPLDDALSLTADEEIDTLVILENDLYRRAPKESVDQLFGRSQQIIVLDHLVNQTALNADILLPAATFAESEGTLLNNEGRAQRYYKAIVNKDQVKESWRWISEFTRIKNKDHSVLWNRFDDIVTSLVNKLPSFSKIKGYLPDADFRMLNTKIPRQTLRYSGRTAMNAQFAVSEPGVSMDPDSPLAFSMEGRQERPPSSLVPFYWTPGWNSVQAMYNYLDEPNGSLKGGDPGVRLIESGEGHNNSYFKTDPRAFEYKKDEWLIVPVYQIFGSEELSSAGSSVAQRIKEPFLYLNQKDSEKLAIKDSELIQLEVPGNKLRIKVRIENSIQQGMAGLSINLPGMQFIDLPCRGKLIKQ
jgi:NADH-quinone oxidoreductase subunit G